MVSLIRALLPQEGSNEARALNSATCGVCRGKEQLNSQGDLKRRIGIILLRVAFEAADALLNGRYKEFDPIVKNFGCQINAAEIQELCCQDLQQEAVRVQRFAEEKLQALQQNRTTSQTAPTAADYLIQVLGLDVQIDEAMARLVRMRLLSIVNKDVEIEGKAVPRTHVELLCVKVGTKRAQSNQKLSQILGYIVGGLQAEESKISCSFLQRRVDALAERRELVQRAVEYVRASKVLDQYSQTPIVSMPLLYNTEAAIGPYKGILCVKNKLKIAERVLEDAIDKRLFLQMPQCQLVDVSLRDSREPIIVIEGYIQDTESLASRLVRLGVMTILRANCAILSQYASGASKAPIEDAEVVDDIARYSSADYDEARRTLDIDHIYAASLGEERL